MAYRRVEYARCRQYRRAPSGKGGMSPDVDADRLLRMSLVLVWLVTGVISLVELDGQSRAVLAEAGLASPQWLVLALIWGRG